MSLPSPDYHHLPSLVLNPSSSKRDGLKYKYSYGLCRPPKTLLWVSIVLRIQFKLLNIALKSEMLWFLPIFQPYLMWLYMPIIPNLFQFSQGVMLSLDSLLFYLFFLLKILSLLVIPSFSLLSNFYSSFRSQFKYNFLLEAFLVPPSLD